MWLYLNGQLVLVLIKDGHEYKGPTLSNVWHSFSRLSAHGPSSLFPNQLRQPQPMLNAAIDEHNAWDFFLLVRAIDSLSFFNTLTSRSKVQTNPIICLFPRRINDDIDILFRLHSKILEQSVTYSGSCLPRGWSSCPGECCRCARRSLESERGKTKVILAWFSRSDSGAKIATFLPSAKSRNRYLFTRQSGKWSTDKIFEWKLHLGESRKSKRDCDGKKSFPKLVKIHKCLWEKRAVQKLFRFRYCLDRYCRSVNTLVRSEFNFYFEMTESN